MAVTADPEYAELSRDSADNNLKRCFEIYIKTYGVEGGIKRVILLSNIFRQKMVKNDETPAETKQDSLERHARIAGEVIGDTDRARKLICQ
ncbi:MAG: hypothetical protein CMH30_02835 [Micavibrio sp.]|nr:hypothetical protein [Micavibrio sp.]|tara:strand:+ start:11233 stop:11505 length:273 start_codon:yes stop_codon:yes gene_type:complete